MKSCWRDHPSDPTSRPAVSAALIFDRPAVLICTLAFLLNLGFLALYYLPAPKALVGDEFYYMRIAGAIARGDHSQHNLLWPPLYGELVGAAFRVFGPHLVAIQVIQIGMWLVSGLLLRQIARRLIPSQLVAQTTLALYFLMPELLAFTHYLWPETVHLFFWMMSLWALICRPANRAVATLAGFCLGLAILTKSILMPFLPVLALFTLFIGRADAPLATRLSRGVITLVALIATILPTLQANMQQYGMPVIADSSVFNLWVGLTDTEKLDYRNLNVGTELERFERSGETLADRNAVYRAKIRELIEVQGPIPTLYGQLGKQYLSLFGIETFFTTQLPGGARSSYQFDAPGLTAILRLYAQVFYGGTLALGAAGLSFVRLRPLGWLHCLIVFIGYNLVLFLWVHVKTRYVLQFLPMLILFASVTVSGFAAYAHGRSAGTHTLVFTKPRAVCGGMCAIAMSVCLLGGALDL